MKSGDMPAMPQSATKDGYPCNYYDYGGTGIPTGMTKREMMAMHMMASIITQGAPAFIHAAEDAVNAADALLSELERTK